MAFTDAEVKAWFDANPNATDKQIADAAKAAGIPSSQLARVTGESLANVEKRASAVGVNLGSSAGSPPKKTPPAPPTVTLNNPLTGGTAEVPKGGYTLPATTNISPSDAEVKAWFDANPNATDKQIADAAKTSNVSSDQLARVTGESKANVEKRASAVGVDLKTDKSSKDKKDVTIDGGGQQIEQTDLQRYISLLNPNEQAFANTLPSSLQDDYLAFVLEFGPNAPLETVVNFMKERGLSFEEAAQATGLTTSDPRYQQASNLYQGGGDRNVTLDPSKNIPVSTIPIGETITDPVTGKTFTYGTGGQTDYNPERDAAYRRAQDAWLQANNVNQQTGQDVFNFYEWFHANSFPDFELPPGGNINDFPELKRQYNQYLESKGLPSIPIEGTAPNVVGGVDQTGVDQTGIDLSSLTADQRAFANTLPAGLQDDYIAYVQLGSAATVADAVTLMKNRGLSFEQAARATGLTTSHPDYQTAYNLYFGETDGDTTGPRESVSGSIVPGQPQVGEVGVVDYMGLQAGQPTLPMGTQLSTQIQDLEATDETLQALTPETTLATDGQYVATPQKITASTVTSPTPQDAVTATASTTDLVDQPEAAQMTAEKSLEQINKEADALQAARQDLNEVDPKATVQGQLALLQEQFTDGEVPVWAQGAFRQVNALMAQRGIGGSTIAAEAITNALMQSALPIAQQDASFYQNVTIQNLSNEQQVEMAKFNARTTAIFNDQAAENAARSLNTQSENELTRFFAELSQNVALANTAQTNAMEQFNATAQNQMTQFFEELALTAETFNADAINEMSQFDAEQANIISQFNASMKDQRERFNVQNQLAIDASNVNWRREVNTANTAATNAALQFDAQNLLAIQQTALNNIWQHYDSLLDFAFRAEEGAMDRASNLAIASMSAEMQRQIAQAESDTGLISAIFEGGTRLLASDSGSSLLGDLLGLNQDED